MSNVKYIEFNGVFDNKEFPQLKMRTLDFATKELNAWMDVEQEIRLINIETVTKGVYLKSNSDKEFKLLRVWYQDN